MRRGRLSPFISLSRLAIFIARSALGFRELLVLAFWKFGVSAGAGGAVVARCHTEPMAPWLLLSALWSYLSWHGEAFSIIIVVPCLFKFPQNDHTCAGTKTT